MTEQQESVAGELRIGAVAVKARLQSGVPVTMLDVRNDHAWEASPIKIAGAIRIWPSNWRVADSWPKDQLTVVY
jgi:hypothetical protein